MMDTDYSLRSVPLIIKLIDPCCSEANKIKKYRAFIFIITLLTYSCYHMSRKPISVVKSILHHYCNRTGNSTPAHLNPNLTDCGFAPFGGPDGSALLGTLDLVYLGAYAAFMFVSGHIAERMNLRYFLTVGMLLCGVTTAAFGFGDYFNIHHLAFYVAIQVLGGVVQASGWPAVVTLMGNWFGKKKRGLIMGFWNSHTSIGNILGALIAGVFVNTNWGLSFVVPGAIIGGMGIVVFLTVVEYPEDVDCEIPGGKASNDFIQSIHSAVIVPPPENVEDSLQKSSENHISRRPNFLTEDDSSISDESTSLLSPRPPRSSSRSSRREADAITIWGALKIPGVVEYSFCLFFAKMVSYTFLFWLPQYINDSGQLDPSKSADLSALMDVGGIIGGIIAGVISDVTGASAVTCVIMLSCSVPSLYIFFHYGLMNLATSICLLIVLGIFVNGPYALITTAVAADLGTHKSLAGNNKALATVTAIIDGTGSIGAALGPLICGVLVTEGWKYVFMYLMLATILAAVLLLRRFIKELIECCHNIMQHRRKIQYRQFDENVSDHV